MKLPLRCTRCTQSHRRLFFASLLDVENGQVELAAAGNKGGDTGDLYVFGDQLGCAVLVQDARQKKTCDWVISPLPKFTEKSMTPLMPAENFGTNQ